jgi:hypothetical protein
MDQACKAIHVPALFDRALPPVVEPVSHRKLLAVYVRLNAKVAALVETSTLLLSSVRARSS